MKVAKLEIKMILALMLIRYEYTLVDAAGKPPKQLPKPNRNDIHQVESSFPPSYILGVDLLVIFSLDQLENPVSFSTRS